MAQRQWRSDDIDKWKYGFGNGQDGDLVISANTTDAPIDNTGSGGGGAVYAAGGSGGSGIVVVRFSNTPASSDSSGYYQVIGNLTCQ